MHSSSVEQQVMDLIIRQARLRNQSGTWDIGITGDHHCRASWSGIKRNSEPSELWCMVESVTAAIASMIGSDFLPLALRAQARKLNRTAAIRV